LASELAGLQVSVMVAAGGGPSALAAQAATAAIPIVFVIGDDPVKLGLVASFSRPKANVTGVAFLTGELGAKRLGLLSELVPDASTIALLLNPDDPGTDAQRRDVEEAANALGRHVLILHAANEADFEKNFATMAEEHVGGLVVQ